MFDQFWANYPRKEDKKYTRKQFAKLDSTQQQKATDDCLTRYIGIEKCFIPLPSTYINKERWEDDPIPKKEEKKEAGVGGGQAFKMYKPED